MRYFAHPTCSPGPYRIVVQSLNQCPEWAEGDYAFTEAGAVLQLRRSIVTEMDDLQARILACDEKLAELEGET